ncbi:hypothetical protein [Aquimarina sp. MMG016]|uniref:fibronectin type III domain-containing protein n=1 Tax=Aquimarina sp. MMG016 TaxID=2822690 RepID=UPI001B3A5105|nr:hypothetical protein [Aquimarina sp. MMG016]MBQ4818723.1 hypothetical protein [Aquimarina sp. MMG016]
MKLIRLLIIIAIIFQSCSSGGDDGPAPIVLGAFDLVFPDNNEVCTEGTDVGNDMVSIPFRWNNSANASSYNIEVRDENGQTYNASATSNSVDIALPKGTQFTWKVTATLDALALPSNETWSFYSEGITADNHIPFPATITLTDNQDGTINISWIGSDLDNDIDAYDVKLGTSDNPPTILSNTQDVSIQNQSINYDTVYYLEIITKDQKGNSSKSKKRFNFKS